MNNVIKLLDKIGQLPHSQVSKINIEELAQNIGLSQAELDAVISSDIDELNKMLDTRQKIVAFLLPAKDDENNDDSEEKEEESEEQEPSQVAIL